MIERDLKQELLTLVKEYPIVTILGPRQAGKTTLATETLATYEYCNLESPENRSHAIQDPKAFLSQFKRPVVIDEIQRVPELMSYIQVKVDQEKRNGQFVLTGSHQLELKASIAQSLAGRTAILQLLPLSIAELERANIRFSSFQDYVIHGFLPRIYDQNQRPRIAYSNYYQTYVERDVRQIINLRDASLFERFMKLLAGRVGQLIDFNSLAGDVGVDAKTIKSWLSIMEASFIVYKLSPYFENFGKRIIKSPKYYFIDVGLLAFLLGLEEAQQVSRDPLVGSLFENLVVIECLKSRLNQAKPANLYFYRDSSGFEIDLVLQDAGRLVPIEIKSTSTYHPSLVANIAKFTGLARNVLESYLVYSGEARSLSPSTSAIPFSSVSNVFPQT
jgi:predicted AAA+ superfamily ATPase